MNSFTLAFNVVFPLLIYMLIGGLIKKGKLLSDATLKQINGMIFQILIPLSLFFDVYNSDLKSSVQPRLFILTAAVIVLLFVLLWVFIPRFVREKKDAATMIQGIYRSNYALFGTAIATSLCGESGAAITAALAVVVVPLFNILAVILFESLRGGKVKFGRLLVQILKNPLVDAGVLGAVLNLAGLHLPAILAKPLTTLGDIATPLALVVLGGMLSFRSMVSHKGRLLFTVACRLVAVPLAALTLFAALGYRNEALVALLAVFASPTAVASVPMAQSMGGNGELAGEIVALASAGSILTVFLFVLTLSGMSLI